jgi:hypothetical protein
MSGGSAQLAINGLCDGDGGVGDEGDLAGEAEGEGTCPPCCGVIGVTGKVYLHFYLSANTHIIG